MEFPIVYSLPPELLIRFFSILPLKDLLNCRVVCSRWQEIIDSLTEDGKLWRKHCRKDFPEVFEVAYRKSKPGLTWYQLYRSLTLWGQLLLATEEIDEFAAAEHSEDEIRDFLVLRDGVMGVQKSESIMYYDANTLQQSNRATINGRYYKYCENDNILLILTYNLDLFIIRKMATNPQLETVTYDDVKLYLLVEDVIYYVTFENEIYMCKDVNGKLVSTMLKKLPYNILCLSFYKGHLYILTYLRIIYVLVDGKLMTVDNSYECTTLLTKLRRYNFLEQLDWRIYFQGIYIVSQSASVGYLRDIITIRMYGKLVFFGSKWGVLRVFYSNYTNEILDLYETDPIKQYNFMERVDCPVLSVCPILQIDVVEGEDEHLVLVAMPKKIAAIKYKHNFEESAVESISEV